MLLGIVAHSSLAYVTFETAWPIQDSDRSVGASAFFVLIFLFRVPAFFILSGFFSRLLLNRLGMRGFLTNRSLRIALPFLIALVPVNLAFFGISAAAAGTPMPGVRDTIPAFTPMHLWFLYYLMITLLLAVPATLVRLSPRTIAIVDTALARATSWCLLPLALGVVTALTLWPTRGDVLIHSFAVRPSVLAYFAVFFLVGWWIQRQRSLISLIGARTGHYAVLSSVALGALAVTVGAGQGSDPLGLILRGVAAWALSLAFIGAFVRIFDRAWPSIEYLVDASYWSYLTHFPIVLGLQLVLSRWAGPAIGKLAAVSLGTIALCLLSYHALVRPTFLDRALSGRRAARAGRHEGASSIS